MEKFWALNSEYELVVDEQLYVTKEDAYDALRMKSHPERYEVTWYTLGDLEKDVFYCDVKITPELKVEVTAW